MVRSIFSEKKCILLLDVFPTARVKSRLVVFAQFTLKTGRMITIRQLFCNITRCKVNKYYRVYRTLETWKTDNVFRWAYHILGGDVCNYRIVNDIYVNGCKQTLHFAVQQYGRAMTGNCIIALATEHLSSLCNGKQRSVNILCVLLYWGTFRGTFRGTRRARLEKVGLCRGYESRRTAQIHIYRRSWIFY